MSFHIGQQNAGVINNTAGNQYVSGGQQGTVVAGPEVLQALTELRSVLSTLPLPPAVAEEAGRRLEEAEAATRGAQADQPRAATALERLTAALSGAGALATAASSLVRPLQTLGQWLGPLGSGLLQMLPGL
jgi:hypothetical protein